MSPIHYAFVYFFADRGTSCIGEKMVYWPTSVQWIGQLLPCWALAVMVPPLCATVGKIGMLDDRNPWGEVGGRDSSWWTLSNDRGCTIFMPIVWPWHHCWGFLLDVSLWMLFPIHLLHLLVHPIGFVGDSGEAWHQPFICGVVAKLKLFFW